jgi:tRNA 2-thiocytidine biosynthesis protein TtcA
MDVALTDTPVTAEPDTPPTQALARLYAHAPDGVSFQKLRKRLVRQTAEAMRTYGMLPTDPDAPPPRWLVCLSGGKDSYGLLAVLMELQARGELPVELLACNLDQGQPGFPKHVLPDYLTGLGVAFRIITEDTYSVVTAKVPEHRTYCSLCSRLRRGILYRVAREEGCQAVVLGHHQGDALETFMLNLTHGGRLAAMPPKLVNDAGDLMVLRPLITTAEADLAAFAKAMAFPIIPCTLCGSQDGLQRAAMKALLDGWEQNRPGTRARMAKALSQVRPSHLLDGELFDFVGLGLGAPGEDDPSVL